MTSDFLLVDGVLNLHFFIIHLFWKLTLDKMFFNIIYNKTKIIISG